MLTTQFVMQIWVEEILRVPLEFYIFIIQVVVVRTTV